MRAGTNAKYDGSASADSLHSFPRYSSAADAESVGPAHRRSTERHNGLVAPARAARGRRRTDSRAAAALSQARQFQEGIGLTGLVLTKLDGTAKGGIVVAICDELKIPVRYIGIGEGMDDLRPFDAEEFVRALF